MKKLSTLLLLSACGALSAQETFQRMVIADYAAIGSMGRDAGGNRYTATSLFADNASSFYGTQAVKYGPDGTPVWHLRLNTSAGSNANCNDMAVTAGGEVVLMTDLHGLSGSPDSAGVIKLDANGELAWARSFFADAASTARTTGERVALAANGDILAAGTINSNAGGLHDDLFLARLTASGTVLWSKRIAPPVANTFNRIGGMVEDAAGGITIFGQTTLNTEGSWLLKLSSTGEHVWCRKYNTTTVSQARPLFLAAHGAGYALFFNTGFSETTDHLYRLNTDGGGFVQSAMAYEADGRSGVVTGVTPLPGGGYAMAGYFTPTGVWDNDATLFTTDAAGAVQWAMRYGSHGYESFNAVEPGPNGGFLAGGTGELDSLTQTRGGLPSSCYLVMTDSNGQSFGCEEPLSISSSPVNFFDITYFQTVTDVAGWANAAVATSTGYEEVAACPALGVNDVQLPTLGLYPNPASDQLTLTSGTALRSIEVQAADGRLVSRQRMLGTQTVDIRALAPGAYVLRALDAQGHVLHGRFVKE